MLQAMVLLAAAMQPAVYVCGDMSGFVADGVARVSAMPDRPVQLRVSCSIGSSLQVELGVPEAVGRNDFDYADFAEPDAAAAGFAATHVFLTTAAGSASLDSSAQGAFEGEGFRFSAGTIDDWLPILSLVDAEPARLVWKQTGFDRLDRRLVADFALDRNQISALRATLDRCLAPARIDPEPSSLSMRYDAAPPSRSPP